MSDLTTENIWSCKVGGICHELPNGANLPMRLAIVKAFRAVTGVEAGFCFSGWAAELTEPERAVVENRLPSKEHETAWKANAAAPEYDRLRNSHDALLAALKAQHEAIDILFAMLIERDKTFFPSKSVVWPLMLQGIAAIAAAEPPETS